MTKDVIQNEPRQWRDQRCSIKIKEEKPEDRKVFHGGDEDVLGQNYTLRGDSLCLMFKK